MQTHLNRIFIIIIISIVIIIIILFWRWNAVRCFFVKVKRKLPLVRQYYSLDTGFKNTSGDFQLLPLQEVTARRYGLFPVCMWKFILEEVQEQASVDHFFPGQSPSLPWREKCSGTSSRKAVGKREQTRVSKRDQGAETPQMSREQLHGGTESRKPCFNGGRKSAEACAKFLAAQEAADSPLNWFHSSTCKGKM